MTQTTKRASKHTEALTQACALMDAAQSGDQSAQNRVIELLIPFIRKRVNSALYKRPYAARIMECEENPIDHFVGSVCIDLLSAMKKGSIDLKSIESEKQPDRLAAYVTGACYNGIYFKSVDRQRRNALLARRTEIAVDEIPLAATPYPVDGRDAAAAVSKILSDRLPQHHSGMLHNMIAEPDLTDNQRAVSLGKPPGTVKARIRRARAGASQPEVREKILAALGYDSDHPVGRGYTTSPHSR